MKFTPGRGTTGTLITSSRRVEGKRNFIVFGVIIISKGKKYHLWKCGISLNYKE